MRTNVDPAHRLTPLRDVRGSVDTAQFRDHPLVCLNRGRLTNRVGRYEPLEVLNRNGFAGRIGLRIEIVCAGGYGEADTQGGSADRKQ